MKKLIILLIFLLLLPGAACQKARSRHVTAVTVEGAGTRKTYEDAADLTSWLTWLRILRPRGKVDAIAPEEDPQVYRITLTFSDLSAATYHLQDFRYFTKDGKTWHQVSPTYGHQILTLLHLP